MLFDFSSSTSSGIFDRYTLEFRYGKKTVTLRVVMSHLDNFAPDFIVISPSLNIKLDYESIVQIWDSEKSTLLILEMIKKQLFLHYFNILSYFSNSVHESILKSCRSLQKAEDLTELTVEYNDFQVFSICVSVPINIKPPNQSSQLIYFNISHSTNSDKYYADLRYPSWASSLSNITQNLGNNGYSISKIEESIRQIYSYFYKEINVIINSKELRELFFIEITKLNLGIILEVDTTNFLTLSMHYEVNNLSQKEILNVILILNEQFPKSSPQFKLRSMKTMKNSELREKKFMKLRVWDSDSDSKSLAELFKSSLTNEINPFLTWLKS